jgi:hypothetical protein
LEPGELVEVRSEKEIMATLDRHDKLKGLSYEREMSKYCGKKFKVYQRVKSIVIEDTGEMRTIKSPTVLLEDVVCDGGFHGDCDRSCFCYWREEWLKRAAPENSNGFRFMNPGKTNSISSSDSKKRDNAASRRPMDLVPGDLVEVRLENEILATLDSFGKYRGLRFTPEMSKYYGKRFRVFKKLRKILVETTGELRTMKVPIVLLERVYCDGSAHCGCDRACFCFWMEEWLDRV